MADIDHQVNSPLALCLSGGGFRATIFHLGVVDYLAQTDRLQSVSAIYGVSGGAIVAAHLAHEWAAYSNKDTFGQAAVRLLAFCNRGMIDEIVLSSVALNRRRSTRLVEKLLPLFGNRIPANAPRTYLVCSSLTDMSQFALEISSRRLFQRQRGEVSARLVGRTSIGTAQAVAMSATFPLVFEPVALDSKLTGLDMGTLGKVHLIADGGVADNLGFRMALANEGHRTAACDYLISDAAQLFDELEPSQVSNPLLSPLRTVDFLMNEYAESALLQGRASAQGAGGTVRIARLCDARKVAELRDIDIDASLLRAALRTRTDFDSFAAAEVIALYRLGVLMARHSLNEDCPPPRACHLTGLAATHDLRGTPMSLTWEEVRALYFAKPDRPSYRGLLLKPSFVAAVASLAICGVALLVGMLASLLR